jgi:hypothetical protein
MIAGGASIYEHFIILLLLDGSLHRAKLTSCQATIISLRDDN